jgi:hypothetical protein
MDGELEPNQVGRPVSLEHITVYQRPVHHTPDGAFPAVFRTADGPVVGGGIVVNKSGRNHVIETPFPVASSLYNEAVQSIASLPPEQQLAALDNFWQQMADRHASRSIAYDVTTNTLRDALLRLDSAVSSGGSLSEQMNALRLPTYVPPQL